jgi:hypothetical protein
MSRVFTSNVAGRLMDVSIFDTVFPGPGKQGVRLGFNSIGGESVTGIQWLAQYVTAALLTEVGSDPYDADYGADLIGAIRSGRVRTDPDVTLFFTLSASRVMRYFRLYADTQALPDDMRLKDIELVWFSLLRHGPPGDPQYPMLKLQVKIVSQAETLEIPVLIPGI